MPSLSSNVYVREKITLMQQV